MRKVKVFSSFLVVLFFVASISIAPGSSHFIKLGNEAWASSVYEYNKYLCIPYYVMGPWEYYSVGSDGRNYTSYIFDSNTGYFSNSGDLVNMYIGGRLYFTWGGNTLYQHYNAGYGTSEFICKSVLSHKQGSFISNLQALGGIYPDNGRHTDGYWYVKVTAVPLIPIITPSPNGTLFLDYTQLVGPNIYN